MSWMVGAGIWTDLLIELLEVLIGISKDTQMLKGRYDGVEIGNRNTPPLCVPVYVDFRFVVKTLKHETACGDAVLLVGQRRYVKRVNGCNQETASNQLFKR
jgi:hypothetical protein